MPTTTQIAVLQQQVDSLEHYFDWTVGGVTATIAILIALFALIQFIFQKKVQESEIKKLGEQLQEKINETLIKTEEDIRTFADNKIEQVETRLKYDIRAMNADIARRFAIDCDEDNLPATAFGWWLQAAVGYAKNGDSELCGISITSARHALEKVTDKYDIDQLLSQAPKIGDRLEDLAKNDRKIESELLKDMFEEKIRTKPETPKPSTG